ncbi:TetR family transcriptional regulator [Streptomyces viridochromogenes DSM 40736]|uniref:TetR family transcriptional regulator n=1 Tax=Streptomyces viridochromogenes (strain DSM 40736 / JCM 4977 / BCRC 1201 / Tue 494) TaxID=591159 RepID=D9XGX9_STRVT|nr:TetR family transcriptional regulator [Streptomyces viridochromogenes]EFL32772.1 TetR family transcriptional regulator [Streptomyces viridochromogenes DSM 40736]
MSSTTPTPTPPQASLTERRKAETRMEIARAAAGLFVRHGLRATRAEDIAQAAGIAPRTFYRYFATKEEAVAPLYAVGAQRWVEAVRAAPADVSVLQALEQGARHTLTPGAGVSASSWECVRTLLRLAEANPSLRRVWAEVCQTSERMLGEVLAERMTRAGAAGGSVMTGGADNVAAVPEPRYPTTPEPRFTAAVASAAVRAAFEGWAEGDGPVEGPGSPAELALRNLAALKDFPWGA